MSRVLPILFNTEMVRAILREVSPKTTTRRAIKGYIPDDAVFGYTAFTPKGYISCRGTYADGYGEKFFKLPCQKKDVLYVRETYCPDYSDIVTQYGNRHGYKADYDVAVLFIDIARPKKWIPSIHMPKEAARIWLKVTDVRVERLQKITEEQAKAEGIRKYTKDGKLYKYAVNDDWWIEFHRKYRKLFTGNWWQDMPRTASDAFKYLWDSTIKKADMKHYGYDANPWVWVIEFERCGKPEGV